MNKLKGCDCGNVGYYYNVCPFTGEPEAEQCEFCYTEPDSVFNHIESLNKEISGLKEKKINLFRTVKGQRLWIKLLRKGLPNTIPTEDIELLHSLLASTSLALIETHHTLSSDLNIAFIKLKQFIPEKDDDD